MMVAIDVGGLRVGYHEVGAGPAVVLLHGYVGDGGATWHRQRDALGDEFRLVAWDAPGFGSSADPPESFGMAGYADCLAGFIAALGVADPHLVGLSFGGALALAVAARHPGLARSLVVVSGYAGWGGSLPPDLVDQRLSQALALSESSSDEFVGRAVADDVRGDASGRGRRTVRRQHAGVPSERLPCHGSGVGRGPPRPAVGASTSRHCWCTAIRMCGPRARSRSTCTPPSPARS